MVKVVAEFKDRLDEALELENIKPYELAKKLNLSQATISHYRSGYSTPKKDRLSEIANILHVNPSWLYGFDVPMRDDKATTEHIRKTLTNIDSVNPLDRVLKRAESDPAYKDCIITILNLKKDIQQEIYDYVDFKACKHKQGGSYDSQQIV